MAVVSSGRPVTYVSPEDVLDRDTALTGLTIRIRASLNEFAEVATEQML